MPAHDNPLAQFVVTSWRHGEVLDSQVARDGDRAAAITCIMVTQMAPLEHGDKIDVVEG